MSFVAEIQANIDDFQRNIDKARAQMDVFADTVGKRIAKLGSKFQMIGGAISIGVTAPMVAAGTAAFNMAADFEDALGATNQIFKEASESTKQWAEGLPTYFGIAKKEALEYSNMMGSMLVNIGNLTEEEASKQSAKLIELAGDLTAMYGGATQDAVRALTGALKGNTTMLDNYGMAANDALVKAKALSMGLVEQGKEMSLSAKQAATLALIYEQSGAAQGQAAREADGASGSMRAFRTEITNLTTELGSVLLPIITPLISKMKEIVAGFRDLSPETKKYSLIVAGAVAALGPLLLGLGAIIQIAPLVGTAFTLMTGPIGIAVVAITAAAAAIYYYWDDIKKVVLNTIANIQQGISNFFNKVSGWANALGFDGMSQSLKDLGGEFQYFSNNTKQKANEIGTEIKKTGESAGIAKFDVSELTKTIDAMSGSAKNAKRDTRDYARELTESLGSLGYYDAALASIAYKYKDLSALAKKAGADAQTFDRLIREQTGEKLALYLDNILNQKDLTNRVKTEKSIIADFKIDPKITFDMQALTKKLKVEQVKVNDAIKGLMVEGLQIDIGQIFGELASSAMESLGQALANGTNVIDAIGKGLLSTLGNLAVSVGKQMMAFGTAALGLQQLIKNPYLAIAAGAALIALGSYASASVNKTLSSGTSSGGSYGSSISSTANAMPNYFQGAYSDNNTVVFEIEGDKLKGILERTNRRDRRTR